MAFVGSRVTVTTAATRLDGALDADANPGQHFMIRNRDTTLSVFVGGPTVTASTGFELLPGETVPADNIGGDIPYGITASGTAVCHVLQNGV